VKTGASLEQHVEVCNIDFPKPEILVNCRASLLVQTPRSAQPERRLLAF
jgi:hypothetical protein